jgi:hypothetical protein
MIHHTSHNDLEQNENQTREVRPELKNKKNNQKTETEIEEAKASKKEEMRRKHSKDIH